MSFIHQRFVALSILVLLPLLAFADQQVLKTVEDVFGQKPEVKLTATLAQILKDPQNYITKDFVIEAKVVKVCQSEGCWLELQSKGTEPVHVTFKDSGFFVPKDILNRTARVQGRAVEKTISVHEQKYKLKMVNAPQNAIDAVREAKKTYEIVASGLAIQKGSN